MFVYVTQLWGQGNKASRFVYWELKGINTKRVFSHSKTRWRTSINTHTQGASLYWIYYIVYLYFSLPFLTVAYTQVSSNLQKPFNNIFYLQFSFLTMPANQRSYNKLQAKKFSWQNVQIILLLLLFLKWKNYIFDLPKSWIPPWGYEKCMQIIFTSFAEFIKVWSAYIYVYIYI